MPSINQGEQQNVVALRQPFASVAFQCKSVGFGIDFFMRHEMDGLESVVV